MSPTEYWEEYLADSMQENGVAATPDQIKAIAKDIQGGHENYGMCFYQPPMSELPVFAEVKELRKKLAVEVQKRGCPHCNGRGAITESFGTRSSISQCYECKGTGKI